MHKILLFLFLFYSFAFAQEPVAVDSRIKTLIYTSNQVFTVEANYGYQSFIEFALTEKIKTIAVGDAVSWNLNPVGNKLFLRPYQKSGRTNMTIITDQRTYVFDLIARTHDEGGVDRNLAYIVRFYYPDSEDEFLMGNDSKEVNKFSLENKLYNVQYENLNRNYSLAGSASSITPAEVFDNSHVTFFNFKSAKIPQIFTVNNDESESRLKMVQFKNSIIVDGVHKNLRLRYKNMKVTVINNDI